MINAEYELNSNFTGSGSASGNMGASVIDNSRNPTYPSVSIKTEDIVNANFTRALYPHYPDIESFGNYSVVNVVKHYKDLAPDLGGLRSIKGSHLRGLMEKHSPKLPSPNLGYQRLEIQTLENRVESLKSAIARTKQDENKNFMLSMGGVRIDLLDTAVIVSAVVIGIFVGLAITVNPFFALGLISLLLVWAALYLAPTDVKRLEETEASKEKLTKDLNQNVEDTTEFYRGQLSADLIRDFKKDLADVNARLAIEPKPSATLLNKQRIEDLRKRAELEKVVKELEKMVEFFKIKEELKAEITPIATEQVFDAAVMI